MGGDEMLNVSLKRQNKNLTQDELAKKVGCSTVYIRKIEARERTPSVEKAKKIALALDFDWTLFFSEEQQEHREAG
jgi:transcriptional regulator with XRE-family HTH domain